MLMNVRSRLASSAFPRPLLCLNLLCLSLVAISGPAVAQTSGAQTPPGPAVKAPEAPPATEQEIAQARELGASGIELYESGAYPEASKQLEHAYKFVKVPTTGLWSARALDKNGNLLEAAERYREVLAMPPQTGEPPVFADARRSAQQELDLLLPRIPKIVVRIADADPATVRVTIDDVELPKESIGIEFPVNPGDRRIVGALGERVERVTLALPERAIGSALLDFSPLAAAPPPAPPKPPEEQTDKGGLDQKTWGYIALGVGGVGLVTGVVASVLASGKESDLDANCPAQQCEPPFHDDVDSLNSTLSVSLVGYLVAAAGLGTGGYLLLTAPDEAPPASPQQAGWSLWFGTAAAGVNGRF